MSRAYQVPASGRGLAPARPNYRGIKVADGRDARQSAAAW